MSKRCQKCGAELADNMNFCPQCHAKYEPPPQGSFVSTFPQAGPQASYTPEAPKIQLPFWAKMWQRRITRKDFWIWTLICGTFNVGVAFIPIAGQILAFIIGYFQISLAFGRLHDAGKSAWNILWYLLPIVGWIILIIFYCKPSEKGENAWGPESQRMF